MANDDVTKKKLPRDAAHLLSIEDQLKEVEAIIREIRVGIGNAAMPTVMLSTGTIFHHIGLAKVEAEKYKGQFNAQKAAHEVRGRKLAEKASAKKRT